jgi:hypothetical protein
MLGRVVIRVARTLWLASGLLIASCALDQAHDPAEEPLPFELSREECDNLIEIDTHGVRVESIHGPDKTQQALDSANPAGASLADYSLTFVVEQTFENLLDRALVIEAASATLSDPESGDEYEAAYDLEEPLELAAHESRELSVEIVVSADRLSSSYLVGLLAGTVGGMTIAPRLLITVPQSDDCGHPEGMEVRGQEGTVEVRRPVNSPVLDGILSGILKAAGHV